MKQLKLLLASLILVSVCLPALASANVNDFTVTNFAADETLTRNDPQGELHIIENINVVFTDYNHGILRAIPTRYKHHSLQLHINSVSSSSGAPSQYTTYGSNGNTVLKIGDPNRTVTGPQAYTIDYTVRNVITFYKDHDELYWDVNGDQWQQPFNQVSVSLHLPQNLNSTQRPLCYTGSFGSTEQACAVSTTTSNDFSALTIKPLLASQTLTYVKAFEKGYFQPSKWYETVGEYSKQILGFALPILVIGGSGFLYWWRRGRDPKGTGVIVPQYEAPDGLKPLEVGTLIDFKADNRDITATIIDLAIRGYIKIIESKEVKKLRKDKLAYSLQLIKADYSALDANEVKLMDALFSGKAAGDTVDVSALKNKLYTTSNSLRKSLKKDLTAGGYFRQNVFNGADVKRMALGSVSIIIFVIVAFITVGPGVITGVIVGGIIAVICLMAIDARTAKGVAAKEHIEGLKMYLNVAEKDRLNKLQGPDAAYAANTAEPKKTVQLFEKLLPYAMVLGVEQQWAKQFEGLYTTPPDWYGGGNWSTFNSYYLVSSLNQGIGTAVNTAFSAPSSSGSSGSGGGGFSGGGGGGGGGGGW